MSGFVLFLSTTFVFFLNICKTQLQISYLLGNSILKQVMREQQNSVEKQKFVWKKKFTLVLVVNAVYILLFYLLMKHLV